MFHSSSGIWGTTGATVEQLPTNPFSTEISTLHTLQVMRALSRRDAHSPSILSIADSLAEGCSTPSQFACAVWFYIHGSLLFRHHEDIVAGVIAPEHWVPLDSQILIPPTSLLEMPTPQGDCAIYSMLTAALIVSQGIPCWFRVTASDPEQPYIWGHVYVVCLTEKGLEALDTSHGKFPGWQTKNRYREMDYPV